MVRLFVFEVLFSNLTQCDTISFFACTQSVSNSSALARRFIDIESDGPIEIPDRSKPNQEIKAPRRRREIVMKMHTVAYASVFQPGNIVFDGKASLFTEKDLGFDRREVGSSYLDLL